MRGMADMDNGRCLFLFSVKDIKFVVVGLNAKRFGKVSFAFECGNVRTRVDSGIAVACCVK